MGSHLVDRLMQEGHWVIVIDNFYTSTPLNVEHWQGHPRFTLIKHDVINPIRIDAIIDQMYTIHILLLLYLSINIYLNNNNNNSYHLASPASPKQYQKDPIYTTKTNVWGTLNMLELSLRNSARFLLASTSEVYGDPLVHPQVESDWGNVNPIGPRAWYLFLYLFLTY